jgi:hypothetical protein
MKWSWDCWGLWPKNILLTTFLFVCFCLLSFGFCSFVMVLFVLFDVVLFVKEQECQSCGK